MITERSLRKGDETMTKRILLAVDTNTASEPVKVAGDLAEMSGADVLVLHCDELDTIFDTGIWLHDDTELRTAIGDAVAQLRDRGIKARGVTVRTDRPVKTAEAIVHHGLNPAVDILVLGLPKFHHLGHVYSGSVAADVAARTTTPLLLVPQSSGQD
jgi:nucleotide-binding universal stress UspA family protein